MPRSTGFRRLVALFLLGCPTVAWASAYTYTTIDPPGSVETHPTAISKRGEVVGWFRDGAGATHGFAWSRGTLSVVDRAGGSGTVLFGVNAAGVAVGQDVVHNHLSPLVYRLQKGRGSKPLGRTRGELAAINDDGTMVGTVRTPDAVLGNGYKGIVEISGTVTVVIPPGHRESRLLSINEAGSAVGTAFEETARHGLTDELPFVWSGGAFHFLPTTSLGFPYPVQIADDGDVVGSMYLNSGGVHGFRFDGTRYVLVRPPRSDETRVVGIDHKTRIYGTYREHGANTPPDQGFIKQGSLYFQIVFPGAYNTSITAVNRLGDFVGLHDGHAFVAICGFGEELCTQ